MMREFHGGVVVLFALLSCENGDVSDADSGEAPRGGDDAALGGGSIGGAGGARPGIGGQPGAGGTGGIGGAGGAPAPAPQVGDACTVGTACPEGGSGTAECLDAWPDGYCAVVGCSDHGHDCPDDPGLGSTATTGAKCVIDAELTCLALCAGDADCREGYTCGERPDAAGHTPTRVCVPEEP